MTGKDLFHLELPFQNFEHGLLEEGNLNLRIKGVDLKGQYGKKTGLR